MSRQGHPPPLPHDRNPSLGGFGGAWKLISSNPHQQTLEILVETVETVDIVDIIVI